MTNSSKNSEKPGERPVKYVSVGSHRKQWYWDKPQIIEAIYWVCFHRYFEIFSNIQAYMI